MFIVKILLVIISVVLVVNLGFSLFAIDNTVMTWINGKELDVTKTTDLWGIRGQIGDILAGHFSALAVFAIAYSIILQVEANKQMRESIDKQEKALRHTETNIQQQTESNIEQATSTLQQAKAIELQAKSIEQQNEALRIQSETLEGQIEELKASREESKKQTEEFFIQNMNVKLDRYYKMIESNVNSIVPQDEVVTFMNIAVKQFPHSPTLKKEEETKLDGYRMLSFKLYLLLEHMYLNIELCKEYQSSHAMFLEEFKLKIHTDFKIEAICIIATEEQRAKYTFFKMHKPNGIQNP